MRTMILSICLSEEFDVEELWKESKKLGIDVSFDTFEQQFNSFCCNDHKDLLIEYLICKKLQQKHNFTSENFEQCDIDFYFH